MNKKSFICLILALLMLTSFTLPIGAFADEYEEILFDDYFDDFYDDQYTESYDYFDDFYDDQYEPYDDVLEEDFYEEFSEDAPIFDEIFDENTEIDTDPLFDESTEETNNDDDNELIGQLAFGDTETFDAAELEIETQPVDWEGPETETASFTVSAKGGTEPYSYQWQYQNATGNWYNRARATEASFSIPARNKNGYTMRCVVTDSTGATVVSESASIIHTAPALEIETQPVDWEGPETETASFTVTAKGGTEPYSYQWQYQNATGNWYNRARATEASFSIPAINKNGYTMRCVVTDSTGATVVSESASIIHTAPTLEIETQPVNWEGPETETASFTVSAKGGTAPYTYQWQYQSKGKWYNRSGATSETFSISANGRDGYTVRCVVTDAAGASVTSNQAVITIAAPQDFTVEGVTYRIISAEEVEIAAYDGTASSLTIPSKVNGYDVTAVGEQAFMNQAITSISLPNSIKYIRSQAFKGCVNLATMTTHD